MRPRGPKDAFSRLDSLILLAGIILGVMTLVGSGAFGYRRGCGSPMKSCQENLTKIDGAKAQFALERGLPDGTILSVEDIVYSDGLGYLKRMPREPTGATYILNPTGYDPICTSRLPGHSLMDVGEVIEWSDGS